MQRLTLDLFKKTVAMDLGTVNTLIYIKGKGIVLEEPSVVTLHRKTGRVVAVGAEAKDLSGRHGEEFTTYRPLRGGVITDFDVASSMMRSFLHKALKGSNFIRPMVVICVPAGITKAERRALIEAAKKAGAGKVYLIAEPMAAALGAGVRIKQPGGHMVVDIGGGTTEVGVVCRLGVSHCQSARVAGDDIDAAICQYVRKEYRTEISESVAEDLKIKLGSLVPPSKSITARLQGKDLSTGLPKTITVTDAEVREAIRRPVMAIIAVVKRVLEDAPPDVASDVFERGIWLAGGGALLRGWANIFYKETGIDVQISHDPIRATIRGIGTVLEQLHLFRYVLTNGKPG